MTDRTPGRRGSQDAREASAPDASQDGVPDILEIFGAAPLVNGAPDAEAADDDEVPTHELDADALAEAEFALAEPSRPSAGPAADAGEAAPEPAPGPERAADDTPQPDAPPAGSLAPQAGTPAAQHADDADDADDEPPAHDAAALQAAVETLGERLQQQLGGALLLLEQRMGSLEETLDSLSKQSSFLPPKLRGLGKKVDELSSSLGDGRLRELFGELVGLADLVEAGLGDDVSDEDARRTLAAVAKRLEQALETRGLMAIDTDGEFDPTRHQAVERRPVGDPRDDGRVVEVFRRGWRDAHTVLRYADVAVGAHDPALADAAPASDALDAALADTDTDTDTDTPADADADAASSELAPATLTPGNVRAAAAPRRDRPTDSPADEGGPDRTAAKTSSRDDKHHDEDDA